MTPYGRRRQPPAGQTMTPHVAVKTRDIDYGRPRLAARYERQSRGDPFTTDETSDGAAVIAALVGQVLRLQQEIAVLAGVAADTETQVAVAYRRLAEHDHARSAEHLLAAAEADRYAAHKREEQHRWRLG